MSTQPPTQPPGYGTRSPDGQWWWDGKQWQPVTEQAPPPPSPITPEMARRRRINKVLVPIVAILGGLLGLGICVAAISSSGLTPSKPAAQATAAATPTQAAQKQPTPDPRGTCSPEPCANDNYGWIVVVGNVKYGVPPVNQFQKPEAGNVFVTLEVTFTNKLAAEQHADPFQFVLQDGAGIKHKSTFLSEGSASPSPCPRWDSVNVTQGATFGPRCIVFEAAADKPQGLTLVWTPHFAGGDYRIKLS